MSRRRFFEQAMGAGGAGLVLAAGSAPSLIGRAQASTPALDALALEGVDYLRQRNEAQMALVADLRAAIDSRDLAAARQAYVDARPPYEEIETLAANFEDSDADIDARPYGFDGGETSPDFRGFHKVEYLLFRDDDLDLAADFAATLATSHEKLHRELQEPERYSAVTSFEGMIGLAEEIGSRKISSEEETWSDQSLLIFRSNIIGIQSQYQPFAAAVAAAENGRDAAVQDAYAAFRSMLEPHETGPGAALTPYSKVGIAERRSISDATYRYRDALIAAAETLGVI
ncbi:MAG: EfeM/EfeO family lipoprotein [Pseudomonadota bacterium]